MLEVRLLGRFEVLVDGHTVELPLRAAQSLLAYLMLTAGTAHRREQLAGLLWPDMTESNAKSNLRHTLWRIRKSLGEREYLLADDLTVAFDPTSDYQLDARMIDRKVNADTPTGEVTRAVQAYGGELLPGFYDEWVVLERERLRAAFESKMGLLLNQLVEAQRWDEVLEWGEHWIAQGQTPEPAYRALMLAYAERGDLSKMALVYQRCVSALRDELGVKPSEQTRTLYERLSSGERLPGLPAEAALYPSPVLTTVEEAPAPGAPPFMGLRYFGEADAHLFFGREFLTAKLVGRLRTALSSSQAGGQDGRRFLAVIVGASGSGKSSIVRAGLIPALKRGEPLADDTLPPEGSTHWPVYVITPTAHPLEALAASLTRDAESVTATATLMDDLARDPRSLHLFVKKLLETLATPPKDGRVFLVVDQFEELFTLCRDEAERKAFVDNLMFAAGAPFHLPSEAARQRADEGRDGPSVVVITLRADFYAHCAQYANLREALANHQEYIGPMSAEELRHAIEEPAKHGGWEFEPGLVDLMLRDVGDEPGALPLLSHALLETWKRRSGRTMTLKGYADAGGVRGAIAYTAETVYQQLSTEQQDLARHVFLELTELGEGTEDTRRRVKIEELIAQSDQARRLLTTLADARLITTGEETAEVAHEALIREWPRLRDWLNEDREGLRLHRQLSEAAHDWEFLELDPGALYRGVRLSQANEWAAVHADALNASERAFLAASNELEQREVAEREAQRQRELQAALMLAETQRQSAARLRRRNRVIIGAGLVALLLALLAGVFGAQANQNATRADQNAAQAQINLAAAQAASDRANDDRDAAVAAQATAQAGTVIRATAQAQAEAQTRLATGRELATAAINNLTVDPERSLWLALYAANSTYAADGFVLPEARQALHQSLLASHARLTLTGHPDWVLTTAYSPDGTRLASISQDGMIKVWDATDGRELLSIAGHTEHSDAHGAQRVAYSPDGKRLVAGDADRVRVVDAASGNELLNLVGPTGDVWAVAYSPDGRQIASSGMDGVVRLWDAETGKILRTLEGHTEPVEALDFSPDGTLLATASDDLTVRLWDVATGESVHTWKDFTSTWAASVDFSPDGQYLAAVEGSRALTVWEVASRQKVLDKAIPGIWSVAFSPDGRRLAATFNTGSESAQIMDAATGESLLKLYGQTNEVDSAAFSPDGKQLATASLDGTVKVWDLMPGHEIATFPITGTNLRQADMSEDWSRLLSYSESGFKVWDAATGELRRELNTPPFINSAGSLAADRVVTVDESHVATIRALNSGQPIATLQLPTKPPWHYLLFSPDGRYFLTTNPGTDNDIHMWDVATGQEIRKLTGHTDTVWGMAFNHDGLRLATTSADGTARIWDMAAGTESLQVPISQGPNGIAFSPDGKNFTTGHTDGSASVWDVTTGRELLKLSSRGSVVQDIAYSADGKVIATIDYTGVAYLWNAVSGEELQTLPGDPTDQPFSPDGTRFAVITEDDLVHILLLNIDDLIALAQARTTRPLSIAECQKYLHVEQCPPGP